jgi:hypothetical protein
LSLRRTDPAVVGLQAGTGVATSPAEMVQRQERNAGMKAAEIARVEAYLRRTFDNPRIQIAPPARQGQPVEVKIGGEFLGTLNRDDDEGEVSYSLTIAILEEDLAGS